MRMKPTTVAVTALVALPLLYVSWSLAGGMSPRSAPHAPAGGPPPAMGDKPAALRAAAGVKGMRPSNSPKPEPSQELPSPSPVPVLQEVDVSAFKRSSHSTCKFEHCPKHAPAYLYLLTPYRNRASAYNRFLRTMMVDIAAAKEVINPYCICATVADYNDQPYGPSVTSALADWPLNAHVVPVAGNFSRAGGFQHLLDTVVTTPRDKSVMFFMDADMVVYPGLVKRVMTNTVAGDVTFCPIVWSTSGKPDDVYDGKWRSGGTGMIAFYYSDFKAAGGEVPMKDRVTYGKEDHEFQTMMGKHSGTVVRRQCTPELWHLAHMKTKWSESIDGQEYTIRMKPWEEGDPWQWRMPVADGPKVLRKRGNVFHLLCQAALDGAIYPV